MPYKVLRLQHWMWLQHKQLIRRLHTKWWACICGINSLTQTVTQHHFLRVAKSLVLYLGICPHGCPGSLKNVLTQHSTIWLQIRNSLKALFFGWLHICNHKNTFSKRWGKSWFIVVRMENIQLFLLNKNTRINCVWCTHNCKPTFAPPCIVLQTTSSWCFRRNTAFVNPIC